MSQIRRIESSIGRIREAGSLSTQSSLVASLATAVRGFVDEAKEEQELVRNMGQLQREIDKLSNDPEKTEEVEEMRAVLSKATTAQRTISRKREALRSLDSQLEGIRREIRKIL